jgi:hypothetical protein
MMDLEGMSGYINGEVIDIEDRRLLDTVYGSERDAWHRAFEFGEVLRKKLRINDLSISVTPKGRGKFYLYLEADAA